LNSSSIGLSFWRTDFLAPGTGIGLATVAKIARVYSGTVRIEETPGGGATFVVDFPVVPGRTGR
ncbi:MAG: hypothetical protein R6W66_09570, partial [Pelovirga sp.]